MQPALAFQEAIPAHHQSFNQTGDKPIYFLYITMDTDVRFDRVGPEIVFPLTYGRAELGDIVTKATSDDVAIKQARRLF